MSASNRIQFYHGTFSTHSPRNHSRHRQHRTHRHHIFSFCSQTQQQKEDQIEEPDVESSQSHSEEQAESDDEYEYEYEYEDEEESEEEEGEVDESNLKKDDSIEEESEYEYEYDTDDELADNDQTGDQTDDIDSNQQLGDSLDSETIPATPNDEISENFNVNAVCEDMLSALWANLPENGRIEGKPVEHFISPLILKPLEVLEDDIHNKFSLMHQDMDNLWKETYKIPMENESELRNVIEVAFDKMNIYCDYIEHQFGLRHSPKHYLMRQIRVDHGTIVFLATRKILYYKYPEWVQSDNWAKEEMSEHNRRKFLISHELGIGLEHLEDDNMESIDGSNEDGEHSETLDSHDDDSSNQESDVKSE